MKNKVRIFGKDIKRAVRRTLMENISEDYEMKDTYSRAKYKQSPREKEIEGVFGQYGEEIPPAVLRYMRKNPQAVIKRLYDVYGNEMLEYIKSEIGPESFYDEAEEGFDDYGEEEEEVEVMGEVEDVPAGKKYTWGEMDKDFDNLNVALAANKSVDATEQGIFITTENIGKRITKNEIRRLYEAKRKKKKTTGKCAESAGKSGCIKKRGKFWRIISNITGKLWKAKYDSEQDAKDGLEAYQANK